MCEGGCLVMCGSGASAEAVAGTPVDFRAAHFHPDHWQEFVLASSEAASSSILA